MKQILTFCLIVLTFFCFSRERVINISTGPQPPLTTVNKDGAIDKILIVAFSRIGYRMNTIHLSAERSITNANLGYTDGDFFRVAGLDKKYPNLIRVPEELVDFQFVAFSRLKNLQIKDWHSLRPYHVAIVTGWKILEENIQGVASLIKVRDADVLFRLLKLGRVDIVVYEKLQGEAMLIKHKIKGVVSLKKPFAVKKMYLYLSKKQKFLVPLITKSLKNMKNDGSFFKIYRSSIKSYFKTLNRFR